MNLLLLSLGIQFGHALDTRGVLISDFYPQDTGALTYTDQMSAAVKTQLENSGNYTVVSLEGAPAVQGTPAELYAETCPSGNHSGCAMIIAQNAGMSFGVTGTVKSTGTGIMASVFFVEVSEMREVISVDIPYDPEDNTLFLVTLERTLEGVVQGRLGVIKDIRETPASEYADAYDEQAKEELTAYSRESGGASSLGERFDIELERKELTREEIQDWMEEEGSKEWDRLDMSAMEYMRYYNSGMELSKWREMAKGKQGALMLRGALGFGYGPTSGSYYGRYARSSTDLQVVETYAWQNAETTSNVQAGGSLGFGILPGLEVAGTAGIFTGRFEIDVHAITVGQFTTAPPSDSFVSSVSYIGGEVLYTPLHTFRVKPLFGLQVTRWQGSEVNDHVVLPEDLPLLPAPSLTMMSGLLGTEARITNSVSAFAYVPLSIALSTKQAPSVQHSGSGSLTSEHLQKPESFGKVATGFVLGIQTQFRLFGRKKKASSLEFYE
ncbi:MAG: hypothetical protein VXZ96_02500 [Myxococcota bacterium]|nr:hypothetical protein [Myxococcota bacterium]MEC8379162.1 hypothetical protein [Myxococcota bacterium]